MKTITKAALAAVLGFGSLGVAQAQNGYAPASSGYTKDCGPNGCRWVPNHAAASGSAYGYGHATPVSTLPAYGMPSTRTICGPNGCYQVPSPATNSGYGSGRFDDRYGHPLGSQWDGQHGDGRRNGDRWNDGIVGGRRGRMFDDRGGSAFEGGRFEDRRFDGGRFRDGFDLDRDGRDRLEGQHYLNASDHGYDWR